MDARHINDQERRLNARRAAGRNVSLTVLIWELDDDTGKPVLVKATRAQRRKAGIAKKRAAAARALMLPPGVDYSAAPFR